jgi:hypothetical protein
MTLIRLFKTAIYDSWARGSGGWEGLGGVETWGGFQVIVEGDGIKGKDIDL